MIFLFVNAFLEHSNFRLLIPSFKHLNQHQNWKLIKIASFGIFSAINAISLQLFLRRYLASSESWSSVGDWQAITKISESYLLLVTIPLSTFLLPEIVKNKNFFYQKKLMRASILLGLFITFMLGSLIFLLWNLVIIKIIGESFSNLSNLWLIQIVGDLFKIVTWTIGVLAIAKMQLKVAFISELIYSFLYVSLVVSLTPFYHTQGPFMAYTIAYLLTCIYFLYQYKFLLKYE
jgi:PST family polysaccharide transporter